MEAGWAQTIEPGLRLVVAPNPSAFTGPGTNTWILGDAEAAVIDPGPDDAAHLEAILRALAPGGRVAHIVVTHAHRDHSGLAPALAARTGAPVWGFGRAEAGRSPTMQRLAAEGLSGGGEGVDTGFAPDRCLGDGDTLRGAGWCLGALHTPGHFAGHLCLAWGNRLFSGDHVMGWASTLVSPPDGDMAAYMASLDRLSRRRWSRLYPGHGAPVDDPAARIAELAAHRRSRERAILQALATGPQDLAALTAQVYVDTPATLHAAAARNALAHLVALCERGLVTADPALSLASTFRLAQILPHGSGRPPRTLL